MSRIKLAMFTLTVLAPADWDETRLEAACGVLDAIAVENTLEGVANMITGRAEAYPTTLKGITVEVEP